MLNDFLLRLLLVLAHFILLLAAAPPFCVFIPPLGAPSIVGVLRMYPSMQSWIFGVLYVELAFCLPSLSLLYFIVFFCLFGSLLLLKVSLVSELVTARITPLWVGFFQSLLVELRL